MSGQTLEEFVAKLKELARQVERTGEAKVIVEFPRRKTEGVDVTVIRTQRERLSVE